MAPPPILPFVTEAAYAGFAGVEQQALYPSERVEGGPPLNVPEAEPGFYDLEPLGYDFPAMTLTTLRDVVVRGKSNILTPPEAIVRHGLIDLASETMPEEFYGRLALSADRSAAAWTPGDPFKVGYLPEAAVFTDGVAFNYAHWLTEVLPRLAAFVAERGQASVPLLVDSDLHPNIMRSVRLVVGADVAIHALAPDALVRVGVLHNVSPGGYVPFKLRAGSEDNICHGIFGPRPVRAMAERLREALDVGPAGGDRPRLFIRRNSSLRRLVNEAEVEQALAPLGFTVVEPERLSLDEQVALYSRAGMVVGATGAACANLLFARADCPTVVIMPRFRQTAYWYWRSMAAAAGAGPVVHVSGEQVTVLEDPYAPLALHQDFRVEVADVLAAVDVAQAISG